MTTIGIPTRYEAGNFRSRLEARWAAMFDMLRWSYVYEPIDADGYIPDFLIEGPRPFFVEVGPCIAERDYRDKSEKADRNAAVLGYDVLVVGASPLPFLPHPYADGYLAAGWLGEHYGGHLATECSDAALGLSSCDHTPAFGWAPAAWAAGSKGVGVYHSELSYSHRPHADGHERALLDRQYIATLWAEAGNRTQWRR
jgi:hypothetical protein